MESCYNVTLTQMRIPHLNTDIYIYSYVETDLNCEALNHILRVFIVRLKVKHFMMTVESVSCFDHEQVCMASFIITSRIGSQDLIDFSFLCFFSVRASSFCFLQREWRDFLVILINPT